jgi:hypothetical protein
MIKHIKNQQENKKSPSAKSQTAKKSPGSSYGVYKTIYKR